MSLKDQLQNDLNQALKAKDYLKRMVLGMLLTAIKNKEIEKRTRLSKGTSDPKELEEKSTLTDDEVIEVVASEVKKRKEAQAEYEKGGRQELAQKEKDEIVILQSYLPQQMSEDELSQLVKNAIIELGARDIKDMGKVIGFVMAKVKGRAEGGLVSKIVKQELEA